MIRSFSKIHFSFLFLSFFLFISLTTTGQTYVPVAVSGFDADGIAETPTNSISCTSAWMDNSGNVMYSAAFAAGAGLLGGIVNSGTIVSGTRTYQLMPFNVPNVLFDTNGTVKIMTINTPGQYAKISLLCFSTELASTVSIVLTFTDGTVVNSGSFIVQDWFNGTGAVYTGYGRCPRVANVTTYNGATTNPMFYPLDINIPCADQTKYLSTITLINTAGSFSYTKACFLALSAVPYVLSETQTVVNELCYGASTGSVTLNVTSNSGPLNYFWNSAPNQTTNPATGLPAGTFSVTVSDAMGCTSTYTATITQPTQLTDTINNIVNASCSASDGSATVSSTGGTGAVTYRWSTVPVQTTAIATNLGAGTYTVTVTDANNCTVTASCTITQLQGITSSITAQTNESCAGQNIGTATVTALSGSGYLYNWSTVPIQTADTAINLSAGSYTVTVTSSNGCTSTSTVIITEPSILTATISAQTNELCNGGNNGSATVFANGGTAGYTYNWNTVPVQTGITATTLPAGIYIVTVSDANNCTATTSDTITQPTIFSTNISAFTNVSACGNNDGTATASTLGGTGAATFVWSSVPAQTTATATNLAVGNYIVTATDANGCTATASVTLIQPGLMTVTTSSNMTICSGATVSVSVNVSGGTAPYSYTWNPASSNSNSLSVTPASSTNYTVTVTDASGCIIIPSAIVISVNASPNVAFSSDVIRGCNPLMVNFTDNSTVAGGDSVAYWYWDFGNGVGSINKNPTVVFKNSGIYTISLVATSSNGCTMTGTINDMITVFQKPVADFTASPFETTITSPEITFTDESTSADLWMWYFGDGLSSTFSNEKNPRYNYTNTGVFTVTLVVRNDVGCLDSIRKNIIIDADFEFYIPTSFTPNNDGLNDVFSPAGYNILEYQMDIYNRWGELIYSTNDLTKGWDGKVNGLNALTDIYIYRINIKDGYSDAHEYTGKVTLIR